MEQTTNSNESQLSHSVDQLIDRIEQLHIEDDETYEEAAEFLRDKVKSTEKRVTATFKEQKEEAYRKYKAITDFIKQLNDRLTRAENHIKKEMSQYYLKREREERQRYLEAKKQAQDEILNQAAESDDEQALEEAYIPEPGDPVPKVEGISIGDEWTHEVIDEKQIPRKYLKVDESKIKKQVQALKADTDIPGVEVRRGKQVRVTAK